LFNRFLLRWVISNICFTFTFQISFHFQNDILFYLFMHYFIIFVLGLHCDIHKVLTIYLRFTTSIFLLNLPSHLLEQS
jgi:hypothetical protein